MVQRTRSSKDSTAASAVVGALGAENTRGGSACALLMMLMPAVRDKTRWRQRLR